MMFSCYLIYKKSHRNPLLIFVFSAGFGRFFSAIFIGIFGLSIYVRYMAPIAPLGLVRLIGFICFL